MGVLKTLIAAGGTNPIAFDVTKSKLDVPSSKKYDLATLPANRGKSFTTAFTSPTGIFFNSTGTICFATRSNTIYQLGLSNPYDVATISSTSSLGITAQDTSAADIYVSSDGLNLYFAGNSADSVHQYTMSTAWTLSTATFTRSFSISAKETTITGLFFKSDGTKMFITGSASDSVHEYALSTAWNISTATFTSTFSVSAKATAPASISFSEDGLRFFILNGTVIHAYTMSTAWTISTSTFEKTSTDLDPSAVGYVFTGLFISNDGHLFLTDTSTPAILSFVIGALYEGARETNINDIFIDPNGTYLYTCGATGNDVFQYTFSTALDFSTISYTRSFDIGTEEGSVTALQFSSDGTKMFIIGTAVDKIHKYTLSTAWNISTATFTQSSASIVGKDTSTHALYISSDGLNLYIAGLGSDAVHQYTMSTAFDLSTMTFTRTLSITSQTVDPYGLQFVKNGTYMYVASSTFIYEYKLTTAWNISTATYTSKSIRNAESTNIDGFAFSSNGLKMYVVDNTADLIIPYIIKA